MNIWKKHSKQREQQLQKLWNVRVLGKTRKRGAISAAAGSAKGKMCNPWSKKWIRSLPVGMVLYWRRQDRPRSTSLLELWSSLVMALTLYWLSKERGAGVCLIGCLFQSGFTPSWSFFSSVCANSHLHTQWAISILPSLPQATGRQCGHSVDAMELEASKTWVQKLSLGTLVAVWPLVIYLTSLSLNVPINKIFLKYIEQLKSHHYPRREVL